MQKLKLLAGSFLTALFLFPAFCSAQTISIVSGNGQLVCPDCTGSLQKYTSLIVQVNNVAGQPLANTTVTWTATQSGFQPVTATSLTNSAGQASYTFVPLAFFFGSNFLPATVVASALNTSVQFVETTATPLGGTAPVFANLVPPSSTPTLTGTAGQTAATSLKVVVSGTLAALPGIQVSIQPWVSGSPGHPGGLPWPAGKPSVTCATQVGQEPGTVLTDATGTATCTPVYGSVLGSGSYALVVGGNFVSFGSTAFTVNPGAPAVIKIISGNNQNVNAGTQATSALVAQVTDAGGNPSNDAGVKWSVTAGSASLLNPSTASTSTGTVQTYVTPSAGPVQVMVALANNSSVSVVFTINVNTVITALQDISGDGQVAKIGTAFAEPLIVQVNDNNNFVPNATVSFAVTSGSATISATSVGTNAAGQAQITATAGATPGPVVITASVAYAGKSFTQAFDLTVNPNSGTVSSIVNAAGVQSQFVSPCSLATIYGTGLATGLQGVAGASIQPLTLVAGVSVQFGGVFAPILDVANVNGVESVSVQVPCEVPASSAVPPATVPMVVTVDGTAAPAFNVTVLPVSPGIFQFTDTDGKVRAVLVRPDGSYASVSNPARRGETIRMFVTGLGQTNPPLFTNEVDPLITDASGNLAPEDLPVTATIVVGVNNGGVLVLSSRYAFFGVGVYEVDFEVPANTAPGNDAPFAIVVYEGNNFVFGNGSLIAIQ